jgi:HEAT repeat protein
LIVWGYSSPQIQNRAVEDCLWLTRGTPCTVAALTSSPFSDRWKPLAAKGASIAMSLGEDASYLDRSNIPEQPISALTSDDPVLRMRVLAQIIYGKTTAPSEQVAPLIHDRNVIVRRLALEALGKLKDPASVPTIEQGLQDEENSVRCAAALALRDNNRPESAAKMLEAVDRFPTHPLMEMVFHTMPRIKPAPREVLAEAAAKHPNPFVRSTAMRSLVFMTDPSLLPTLTAGLRDTDRFVRFAATEALGHLPHSTQAVETLIGALKHEDPTVSDRAATSLAMIVTTKTPEVEALRSRIAARLGELYAKLGDGCTRSDAEWGYRPVGNALLKIGPEGEQILQGFMDQQQDRQLALEAWKTLWIRQDTKTFSEVTEKENDESFRHLPAWLRTSGTVQPVAAKVSSAPAAASPPAPQPARQWYVDPEKGDDHLDGLSSEASRKSGPLKTIALAVRRSGPGDTINLAKAEYHEQIGFFGQKSGEPGRPITVDGHGAVIVGSLPLDESQWTKVGPGLYRNDTIYKTILHSKWEFVDRFSFIFDGKLNRMNHSVKAPKVTWKKPEELQIGEWTYQADDNNSYYLKIDPNRTLADYHIEQPTMVSGVQIDGNISHLVFRNITVTHVVNDGFALRTSPPGSKIRDILYQHIRTIEACDDGFSAHDDCEVRVEDFVADGCSTGIATAGKSFNDRVVTRNIHGVDLLFIQGEHTVTNSRIEAHGGTAGISVSTAFKTPGLDSCTLLLDNVVVTGPQAATSRANRIEVRGAKARLEIRHADLSNMSLSALGGAGIVLNDSVIRGNSTFTISVPTGSSWTAEGNLYGDGKFQIGDNTYSAKDFAAYQSATKQDGSSRIIDSSKEAGSNSPKAPPPGANLSRIP